MKTQQKIDQWAEKELRRNLHTMIVEDGDGGYVVFGKYYLCPAPHGIAVYNRSGDLIGQFANKRTAMSWCVADNKNLLNLAQNIKNLDTKLRNISSDIGCRRQVAERSRNNGFNELVLTKLQTKIERQTMIGQELEKCLNLAKYIQLRGFQNETARTSGHQAN